MASHPAFRENCLPLLRDLVKTLSKNADLDQILDESLKLLAGYLGIRRGAITLLEPHSARIRIEAAFGLNARQRKRGEYLPGEGITGKVIELGKPIYVADISREPLFLNRTGARDLAKEQSSFLCVPIFLGRHVAGALSVDLPRSRQEGYEDELALLQIIAALFAQTAYYAREKEQDAEPESLPPGFVGRSQAMRHVYQQIEVVAPSRTTVCLFGESGTGKELAAHAIHAGGENAAGPFLSLNCAVLPENLVESELFGHERGAFTGATHMRKGKFELAQGGSLFLDEIGELSLPMQAKLLRVIQERVFERLGGDKSIQFDARLIVATNRDLATMVDAGTFRRDLYYRLNVFPITLPSLVERIEDVPILANHFLEYFARQNNKKGQRISFSAMDLLQRYKWPGNVRELQNAMERASLLAEPDSLILPGHLPVSLQDADPKEAAFSPYAENSSGKNAASLPDHIAELEKAGIEKALRSSMGRIGKAARLLGLTSRVLGLRLKKYHIDYREFRKKKAASN